MQLKTLRANQYFALINIPQARFYGFCKSAIPFYLFAAQSYFVLQQQECHLEKLGAYYLFTCILWMG